MILLVGDLHFDADADPRDVSRRAVSDTAAERALAECLGHFGGTVSAVVLLGDVFDAYVEYPRTVPRPPMRLFAQLTRWHERGVKIHYLVGNHDPWHRDWIERDLGWTLHRGAKTLELEGVRLHVSHGDREERRARGRTGGLMNRIVRSRLAMRLYTRLLPGDAGQGIARWVSRTARSATVVEHTVTALRASAAHVISSGSADIVAYGHSHVPAIESLGGGWYINPGLWPATRTIGLIEAGIPRLVRWTGADVEDWQP